MKNIKKLLIPILCTCLLLTGCGKIPTIASGEQIIAKMNEKDITVEELYTYMKKSSGYNSLLFMIDEYIANKEVDQTAADEYVDSQIASIKEECKTNGYKYEDFLAYYGYKNESALKETIKYYYNQDKVALKYVEDKVVTEKEIKKYYDDNIFGELTIRYILVTPVVTDTMTDEQKSTAKAEALEKANSVQTLLKNYNGDDLQTYFTSLVATYSDDAGTKNNGGLLTNFVKSDTGIDEALWNTAYKLAIGKTSSAPISTQYGYYIIYKVAANAKPELDTVKDTIKTTLAQDKITNDETLTTKAWDLVRKSYNLEIIDSEINKEYNTNNK